MHDDVPLVVAGVNPDAAAAHTGHRRQPELHAMVALMALAPIHRAVGLERLVVSSYQAVSGTGQRAIEELLAQSRAVLAGEEAAAAEVYPHRIAFNVLPQVEVFKDGDDYTTEERKVMAETRKILGDRRGGRDLAPPAPACRSSAATRSRSTSRPARTSRRRTAGSCSPRRPGVVVVDDPAAGAYPMAIDAAGRDEVLVGRIRRDPGHERCLNLWVVGDNLRKGAATNAVQVAELLVERGPARRSGSRPMDIGFGDALLLFGGLLAVVAALSGVMRGTVLSASVLSVALGIAARRDRRRQRRRRATSRSSS